MKKPNGYWTFERCKEEALKYTNKKDFRNFSRSVYSLSTKNMWLDEICIHMENRLYKYWTKEKCIEEVSKYNTKKEFMEKSPVVYNTSYKYGWLDEITNHLIGQKKNFWIYKENCKKEALKYDTLSVFAKMAPGAYKVSSKNGWLDEITSHMSYLGNKFMRLIYVYEFSDNSVYIGLTYNLEKRNYQHNSDKNSKVFIHMNYSGLTPKLIKLTDYIEVGKAQKMEYHFLRKYKNNGFNILNKAKTGGIGGSNIKWTKERCMEEALKYNTYKEFSKYCNGAYNKCLKEKWFDELCEHLIKGNSWTYENCKNAALKYVNRSDYQKYERGAYSSALRNKWLDEICSHMTQYRLPNGYWTKERCHEEALKYNDKKTYSTNSNSSYLIACRNGWIKEICSHMTK
jgi:predicted GIY-YIG superfamily endonuclease